MQLLERGANAAAQNRDQMKAIDITDDDLMRDILNDADRSLGDCTERCSHVVAMPCASAIELFIHGACALGFHEDRFNFLIGDVNKEAFISLFPQSAAMVLRKQMQQLPVSEGMSALAQ